MQHTALLVIDFINDIIDPDGKISSSAAFIKENAVIKKVNQVISFARQNKIPVVFVKVGFSADYIECPTNSPIFSKAKEFQALKLNSWGTEFDKNLNRLPTDLTIIKHRVSAFYATSLEAFLHANKIQTLIIAGVSTDMAVQSTARDAHDRDYNVTIISDACAAASSEMHENTLKMLQRFCTVVKSDELK